MHKQCWDFFKSNKTGVAITLIFKNTFEIKHVNLLTQIYLVLIALPHYDEIY